MAESAVSFLLDQLSAWLRGEQQLLGGLEQEVQSIRDQMEHMREFLGVADAKEESNPELKQWVRQLREISYDIQDVLDKYMLRFGRRRGTNGFSGCIRKVLASIKNLKARHQIASEIQAIKYRLENASKSQQRYRDMYAVMDQGSSSTIPKNERYDGRCEALLLEEADVVGIEEPKKQLLKWIWSMEKGLEVISVVGMGGLGKTTLVKKVYDDEPVKRYFNRHVWIVASDYTNPKHLLANLIRKLVREFKESAPQELEDMSVDEMGHFIYEFLKAKKYIIVLDDVWDMSTWEAVRFALPKRDAHGCIIITTRDGNIGNAACESDHVYNLEPLSVKESKILFYENAFPRNSCPPAYIREIAENILKRCDGLPLAIVVIGRLLKNKGAEEWKMFNRSLTHELDEGDRIERLWKLFSLSYNELPYYLKYCFLYLSIFPEGGLVEKEKVIRLWTAEGFVQSKRNKTMEEVGDHYLNELCSRSLIQVAEREIDGRARAFRIHDLLRDYITSKAREQNIVTIYNGPEIEWPNKIRRLAIQKSINFSLETNNFEYLRSLQVLCDENSTSGPIKELLNRCRLLKVLDLRGASLETSPPNEVFKLYHLKYLSLRNTKVEFIPKSIKYLENLETLDLKNCNVTELPIEILKVHRLRHLLVYKCKSAVDAMLDNIQSVKAPCGIGSCLLSLQKLTCIDADEVDGIKIVREIGKLTHLRRLGIAKLRSEDGKELCSSIAKLTNLRSLNIRSIEEGEKLNLNYSLSSVSLPFLRTPELFGWLEKVPQWIPSLDGLTTLLLTYSRLRDDPLNCLQDLPNLAELVLHGAYVEGLSFKAHGFHKLKKLWLGEFGCLKWVIVEKGSMPFLEEWHMRDCKLLTELPQGMEHLTNLQLVRFTNMGNEFVDSVVTEAKNEGDNSRLAHASTVEFYTLKGGKWSLDFALR